MKQRRDLTELFPGQLLKMIPTYGAKNNWDQDKDQTLVAILCHSSSSDKTLGSKPTETVHLRDFSLEKFFRTSGPQLWSFPILCYLNVCWVSALLRVVGFLKEPTFILKDSIKRMTYEGLQAGCVCISWHLTVFQIKGTLKMWVEVLVKASMNGKVGGVDRYLFKVIWIFKVYGWLLNKFICL